MKKIIVTLGLLLFLLVPAFRTVEASGDKFVKVSAGREHVIALTESGKIFTWGRNEKGQLGTTDTVDSFTPVEITENGALAGLLASGDKIIEIYAEDKTSLLISDFGRVFVFGESNAGNFSNGDFSNFTVNHTPVEITELGAMNDLGVDKIVTGAICSNAIVLVSGNGRVFSSGSRDHIGINNGMTNVSVMIEYTESGALAGLIAGGDKIVLAKMSADYHRTVLVSQSGRVFTHGNQIWGMLGNGANSNSVQKTPIEITENGDLAGIIAGGDKIVDVSLSGAQTYLISQNGDAYGFGINNYGEIGSSVVADLVLTPTKVTQYYDELGTDTIIGAANLYSTTAVLSSGGKLFTSGVNNSTKGMIGNGSTDWSFGTPQNITESGSLAGLLASGDKLIQVAGEDYYFVALSQNGGLFVWGENEFGELGLDPVTIDFKNVPTLINDTTPPVLTVDTTPITIDEGGTYNEPSCSALDDVDCALTCDVSGDTVDVNTPGVYEVIFSATDAAGNEASETLTVTVNDITAPVVNVDTTPITLEAGIDTYVVPTCTVTDNVEPAGDCVVGGDVVDESTVGVYVVTFNKTDAAGNAATEKTVTVNVVDTTTPVINVDTTPITLEAGIDTFTAPACDITDNVTAGSCVVDASAIDINVVGEYNVYFDYTDPSGNVALQQVLVVTVEDTTLPVINVDTTLITLEAGIDTFVVPTCEVTDNVVATACVVGGDVVDESTPGTYTVLFDYTDPSGNVAMQKELDVEVVDTTAPVIVVDDTTIVLEAGNDTFVLPTCEVTDNVSAGVCIPGGDTVDVDTIGEYEISFGASDGAGNQATPVMITVQVVDTTAPVINLSFDEKTFEVGSTIDYPVCTVTDFETGLTCTMSGSADMDTLGEYTITYDVQDSSMNDAVSVTYTVTVEDTTAPVITVSMEDVLIEFGAVSYEDITCSALDNVDDVVCTFSDDIDYDTLGTYEITVTATDLSGNSASETIFAIVQDTIAPIVNGVEDGAEIKSGEEVTITFNEGTATLNGEAFTSGTVVNEKGEYVLKVIDDGGNETEVNFEIKGNAALVTIITVSSLVVVGGGVFAFIRLRP